MSGSCRRSETQVPLLEHRPIGNKRSIKCKECSSSHIFVEGRDQRDDRTIVLMPGMQMSKPTHVNLESMYEVTLRMLDWEGPRRRIDDTSIDVAVDLANETGLFEQMWRSSYLSAVFNTTEDTFPFEVGAAFLASHDSRNNRLPLASVPYAHAGCSILEDEALHQAKADTHGMVVEVDEGSVARLKSQGDLDALASTPPLMTGFKRWLVMRIINIDGLVIALVFGVCTTAFPTLCANHSADSSRRYAGGAESSSKCDPILSKGLGAIHTSRS